MARAKRLKFDINLVALVRAAGRQRVIEALGQQEVIDALGAENVAKTLASPSVVDRLSPKTCRELIRVLRRRAEESSEEPSE